MKKIVICMLGIVVPLGLVFTFFIYSKTNQIETYIKRVEDVKVSVIIPVYNVENYLRACLKSVQNQTLEEFEVICIDDGSLDKSGEILEEYSKRDTRFRVYHQQNSGVSATRNRGVELANGEYIKFVDSDDTIAPQTLEKCYKMAKDEDADIVRHNSIDEIRQGPQFELIWPTTVWGGMYRTRFFKGNNIKFDTGATYGEDQAVNLICNSRAKKIVYCSENLYNYVNNPNSLCRNSNFEKYSTSHAKSVNVVYEDWKKNGYFENDQAKIGFLNWFADMNQWKDNCDVNRLFLASIGSELLEDDVLELLSEEKRNAINNMKDSVCES